MLVHMFVDVTLALRVFGVSGLAGWGGSSAGGLDAARAR